MESRNCRPAKMKPRLPGINVKAAKENKGVSAQVGDMFMKRLNAY